MMKNIVSILLVLATFAACEQKPDGYVLNGNLRGVDDGTQVFLRRIDANNQPMDVDTATVQNGTFTFSGQVPIPEMHYIFVDGAMGYTGVILEDGNISLSAQKDSIGLAELEGTPQNDLFADYMEQSQAISLKARSVQDDMRNASIQKDTATMVSLRDEMNELQEEFQNFELTYIKEHPNALISVLLLDRALASRTLTAEEARELYEGLGEEIKKTEVAKKVSEALEDAKQREENAKSTDIGAMAPEFSGPTPSGGQLALAEAKGKITLIDFWAAWCRPCRAENPNVVRVYEKYHDKGLNIVGVSLDKTEEAWKKAIAEDGLDWHHISNLAYFDDEIAKMYNVDAIPAAFLLDENGVIVAKNLRGPALEDKVAELLQ